MFSNMLYANSKFILLHRAIYEGKTVLVDSILDDIKSVNDYEANRNEYNVPILIRLFSSRNLSGEEKYRLTEKLIAMGADVHDAYTRRGITTITFKVAHSCAAHGDAQLLKLLEDKGANLFVTDSLGRNALYYAFSNRNALTANYLLKKSLTLNCRKTSEILLTAAIARWWGIDIRDIVLLAPRLSADINAIVQDINSLGTEDKQSTVLHALISLYPNDILFLIRTLLEAGADPTSSLLDHTPLSILLSPQCDRYENDENPSNGNFKRIYMAGLLVDYGAILTDAMIKTCIRGALACWPTFKIDYGDRVHHWRVLKAQSEKKYSEALNELNASKNYDFVLCRKAKLHQLMGNYGLAFEALKIIVDYKHVNSGSDISVSNELVDLFYTWNNAVDERKFKIVGNNFHQLFEIVIALPTEELTSDSHGKLAAIYLEIEGLSFSERREKLEFHYRRVIYGKFKEPAKFYLDNLSTPQNQFKHELDKILTKEMDLDIKKALLVKTLNSVATQKLRSVGVQFILEHSTTKEEKLLEVVKSVRHSAVQGLIKEVDNLVTQSDAAKALEHLKENKDLPLFSMLKAPYFFKSQTKAVAKINAKIQEITKSGSVATGMSL